MTIPTAETGQTLPEKYRTLKPFNTRYATLQGTPYRFDPNNLVINVEGSKAKLYRQYANNDGPDAPPEQRILRNVTAQGSRLHLTGSVEELNAYLASREVVEDPYWGVVDTTPKSPGSYEKLMKFAQLASIDFIGDGTLISLLRQSNRRTGYVIGGFALYQQILL